MLSRLPFCVSFVLLGCLAWAAPAHGAQTDRYLPNDSEFILTVNLRQVFDSPVARMYGPERIRAALGSTGDDKVTPAALGLDPVRDVSSLVLTRPGDGDAAKGLLLLHGPFDLGQFQARAAELVRGGRMQVVAANGYLLYQCGAFGVFSRQRQAAFLALVDAHTLAVSPSWPYLVEALDKAAGKKRTFLDPQVQNLINTADDRQSLWVVARGHATLARLAGDSRAIRDIVDDVEVVTGGLTVGSDLQPGLVFWARDDRAARRLSFALNARMKEAGVFLAIAGQRKYRALEKSFLAIQVAPRGRAVVVTGHLPAEMFELALAKMR